MDLDTILSIVGILLAILSFFASPDWVKSIVNKTILSNRQKRIDTLKENYDLRVFYFNNRDVWTAALIGRVSSALYQLTLFVFWIGIYTVSLIRKPETSMIYSFNALVTYFFLITPLARFNEATQVYNDVLQIAVFRQKTIDKLRKLVVCHK